MSQIQKFGMVKKFIHFLRALIHSLKPRYNLSLDSYSYDINHKKIIYFFKVFGDHSFVKFGFDDIQNCKDLLFSINPSDLITIATKEQLQAQKKLMVRVTELLRDNKYKISDGTIDEIFSGDEICDNPSLMERISNLDLYKISYNTGFSHGRALEKIVREKLDDDYEPTNIIKMNTLSSAHNNEPN